jgi:hypothetical protein
MHELENDSKRVTRDIRSVESATQILTTQERIAVIARYEAHRRWIGDDDDTACRGID